MHGEGVWWEKKDNYIVFKDGDDEVDERVEGPTLMDFSKTQIHEVFFKFWQTYCNIKYYAILTDIFNKRVEHFINNIFWALFL